MKLSSNGSTRAESWLRILLIADILAGAVWWYAWPWLRSDSLFLTLMALNVLGIGSAWVLMRRTRRRRESERAVQLEQEMWQATLPAGKSAQVDSERVV